MKNSIRRTFYQELGIHLSAWIFLFALPPMLLKHMGESLSQEEFMRMIAPPLLMATVFYVNYLWLVPKFLLTKRYKVFLLMNVGLSFAVLGLSHIWFEVCNHYFPHPPFRKGGHAPSLWAFILFRVRDLVIYGMVAAFAGMIRISKRWQAAEIGRQNAELQRTEAELRNLRNQINPHFLLNTLNNIYALIAFDTEKAQQAVQDLSRLFRHLLYDNNQEWIPLNRELELLKNYVSLMKIRLTDKVDVQFHIDVPEENGIQIAPLIFISLLENAFKHGISPINDSFIHIRIFVQASGTLTCHIANSNYPKTQNDISGSGIGLVQVQRRLDLIYPGQYIWNKGTNPEQTVYVSELTIKTN